MKRYAITYTAYSRNGPLVSLALTKDFKTFERRGPIMQGVTPVRVLRR